MNYRQRGKERRTNWKLTKVFSLLKFKSLTLSFGGKIVLSGSALLFFTLFMPWVIEIESNTHWNSFHAISGNIGYFLITINLIQVFLLLSSHSKEKLQLHSNISFRNYFLVLTTGIITMLSAIISLSFINGLQTFFEGVNYGNGSIFTLVSGILITFGGFLMRQDYKNTHIGIFMEQEYEEEKIESEKNNMKLPF